MTLDPFYFELYRWMTYQEISICTQLFKKSSFLLKEFPMNDLF